jgi:hypothetical protein
MANIPSNLSYGTVKGRFIVGYKDSADSGSEPDAIPASGSIFFTASPTSIKNSEASPVPVTIFPAVAEATLDSEGYLCGYGTTRGIILIATDDPSGNPVDWTWRADFRLTDSAGTPLAFQPFSFELPSGEEIDLTLVAPVSESDGQVFLIGPQGIQGIQGIQGPQGSIENFVADAPLYYDTETATITFDETDYVYTAGDNISIVGNEISIIESPTFTGTVAGVTKDMVGLGDADNTSDADKPVSTDQQNALDLKADLAGATFTGTVITNEGITNAQQKNALIASGYNIVSGGFSQDSRTIMTSTIQSLIGTATISIATPGVVTSATHGLTNGSLVYFTTTGALPTGLLPDVDYFVINSATNTFQLSLTLNGTAINTSGTQSGTHVLYRETFPATRPDGTALVAGDVWISY